MLFYGRMGIKQPLGDYGDKDACPRQGGHASLRTYLHVADHWVKTVSKPIYFLYRATGFVWTDGTYFVRG